MIFLKNHVGINLTQNKNEELENLKEAQKKVGQKYIYI